jgi:pimeloyl-ACP methyl ester carboxylesterase
MDRRLFILTGAALALAGLPAGALAVDPPFRPSRFSVEVRGAGSDVLLIPGLTSGREVWRPTAGAVPGYRYHLLHVSGFAGEPVRGNGRGAVLAPLADEIARYISERRLRRPAIVGHSMGGTLAMMIAARRPELVGRVMVVDMLPEPAGLFGGSSRTWTPFAGALRDVIGSEGGRRLFGSFMSAFTPPGSNARDSDPDMVGRVMHELAATDLAPQLPRIRAPLTIVYAAPDARSRAAIDRGFAQAYASARTARFVRIDDSGHMVMLDQPARFRAVLRDFLAAR